MTRFTLCSAILLFVVLFVVPSQCFAMISVGTLSQEQAREYGITMHHRKNGDAGVQVWLEFKKVGFLEKFSYCELRMKDRKGPRAALTEQGKRRGKYTWWYKTQIQAKGSGVHIEQFGSFVWRKGQWEFANYTRKPFATKDFSEWYSCPDGLLRPGKLFEDPTNWGSSDKLSASKALWYFIGVDEEGRRVKGEAVINGLGELVKEKDCVEPSGPVQP